MFDNKNGMRAIHLTHPPIEFSLKEHFKQIDNKQFIN